MKGGFSFRDIDIANIGLTYVPELEDTFVYRPASVNIYEETFDGHNGGYFYGSSREPKEFTLRCYFEDKEINKGVLDKVYWLFRAGSSGKLVFQRRPWCYYYATVTEIDDKELFNHYNGIIKVTMKAYYPYARSDALYCPSTYDTEISIDETTGFIDAQLPNPNIVQNSTLVAAKSFLLYNPGTEPADVGIEIAGEAAEGVVIENTTTNQQCEFIALTDAVTTDAGKYVYYDGINGKTILKSDSESAINSIYHNHGFIQLAPSYPVVRDVYVYNQSGTTVKVVKPLYDLRADSETFVNEYFKGKYIYLNTKWYKIDSLSDEHTVELEESSGFSNVAQKTVIVTMNELTVRPKVSMRLSKLNFLYKPTFA